MKEIAVLALVGLNVVAVLEVDGLEYVVLDVAGLEVVVLDVVVVEQLQDMAVHLLSCQAFGTVDLVEAVAVPSKVVWAVKISQSVENLCCVMLLQMWPFQALP